MLGLTRQSSLKAIDIPCRASDEDLQKLGFSYSKGRKEFEKSFNAYRGATFGLQPTLKQSNHFRPQSKSLECENLYFTGSSTHPGAGVPIAFEGGKICAEEVRRDMEDAFK